MSTMTETPHIPASPPTVAAKPETDSDPARSTWRSEELLGSHAEVLIVHGSEVYRLRRTRQDKLILYK